MKEKPTKMAFEKQYNDGSGVEYAVRFDNDEKAINDCKGTVEFECIDKITFPLEQIDWLIDVLTTIRDEAL